MTIEGIDGAEIDISNPPVVGGVPDDLYADVYAHDDEFPELTAYDIGVVIPEPKHDVPPPADSLDKLAARESKPRKPRKPRAVRDEDDSEFVASYMQLPERLEKTVVGKLARVIHEKIEFPEVSAFFALLATASCSTAAAFSTRYSTPTSCVALGLYAIVEQPPAMMKSYLIDVGMDPYREAISQHNRKVGAKNIEIAERGNEDIPQLKRGFTETSDGTSASIDGFMTNCSEGRFVIASAEQSGLISLFPETGSFSSTNELILKGYAGEFVSGMRATRKAFAGIAYGSIAIIAQPGSSKRVLAASGGSGMAERFFYLAEPDPIGFRKNEGRFPTPAEMRDFQMACIRCVDIYSDNVCAGTHKPESERVIQDPKNLRRLHASSDAYRMILDQKHDNEDLLYDLKQAGEMVMMGWLSKLETHVIKIAANLHVIECMAHGVDVPELIPNWIVEDSLELTMTVSKHIQEILNKAGESGSQAEEEVIIDILAGKPLEKRALGLKAKNRKPFKAMPSGFKVAARRIDAMLAAGILQVSSAGKIEIV